MRVRGELGEGIVEIIDTPAGERLRFTSANADAGLDVVAEIARPAGPETLILQPSAAQPSVFLSAAAPAEPHEFEAVLRLRRDGRSETLDFKMCEPDGHGGH